jgi:subtilisin family serine protease
MRNGSMSRPPTRGIVGALVVAILASVELSGSPKSNTRFARRTGDNAVARSAIDIASRETKQQRGVRSNERRRRAIADLRAKARVGPVAVIVQFDLPLVPEGLLSGDQVGRQHDLIATVQDQALGALPAGTFSGVKKFETIPYLAIQVDSEALLLLASAPAVISIVEDKANRPMLSTSVQTVQANRVHPYLTGSGQTIAIIDSGVDKYHPAFGGRVVSEACYSTNTLLPPFDSLCPGGVTSSVDNDSGLDCDDPALLDECRHGTHVAGIAAGISGVAPGAQIIAIQAGSKQFPCLPPAPSPCLKYADSDVVRGLERVLALSRTNAHGSIASVNLSLGSGAYESREDCEDENGAFLAAIQNLRSVRIATIAATGNDAHADGISSPSCVLGAVPVGATWNAGDRSPLWEDDTDGTNRHRRFPILLAPGASVRAPIPCPEPTNPDTCTLRQTAEGSGTERGRC